jgi:hypothetical protein
MKRQDILEIIVSNPQAIFKNANAQAGKYSEYPTHFQVVGTGHDKSYVLVKEVSARAAYYLLNEEGEYIRDENGNTQLDTRPVAERSFLKYERCKSMPTRLVLKSDITEASMLADYIAKLEADEAKNIERETEYAKAEQEANELEQLLTTLGITNTAGVAISYYGRVMIQVEKESITRLVSALKSALVEVGV